MMSSLDLKGFYHSVNIYKGFDHLPFFQLSVSGDAGQTLLTCSSQLIPQSLKQKFKLEDKKSVHFEKEG